MWFYSIVGNLHPLRSFQLRPLRDNQVLMLLNLPLLLRTPLLPYLRQRTWIENQVLKMAMFGHQCVNHVNWTGHRMLKLVLNAEWFLLLLFFNWYWVLHFGANSSYECSLIQKKLWSSIRVICSSFRTDFVKSWKLKKQRFKIPHQFQNSMALLKWHDARINITKIWCIPRYSKDRVLKRNLNSFKKSNV